MRKLAHHDWKEVVRLKKWIAATLATVAIIAMGVAAAAFAATPAQPGSPKIIKIMGKNGYIGTMVLRGNKYVLSGPQGAARTSEGGNNVGAPPGWSEVVCAGGPGGETIVLGPADELPPGLVSAVLAALERGTAWYATKDGQTVLFLSGEPDPEDGWEDIVEVSFTAGACPPGGGGKPKPVPGPPPRAIYCTVEGNTHPYTGEPIRPGTALNLVLGQPDTSSNYKGATPANYIQGGKPDGSDVGASCDALRAGDRPTNRRVDGTGEYTDVPGAIYPEIIRTCPHRSIGDPVEPLGARLGSGSTKFITDLLLCYLL